MLSHFCKITLCLFAISPSLVQAGNKVGNGGNIISCKTTRLLGVKSVLLDFYENEVKLETTSKKYPDLVKEKFAKLKGINDDLSTQYLNRFEEMQDEIEFKANAELITIADSKHLFTPPAKDCTVIQTAIRRPKISGSEKRFLIRKDIWDSLTEMNKAGLITHEIIYEHFTKLGEEDSIKARKVNASLYKNAFTRESFWNMMRELEVPIYPQP